MSNLPEADPTAQAPTIAETAAAVKPAYLEAVQKMAPNVAESLQASLASLGATIAAREAIEGKAAPATDPKPPRPAPPAEAAKVIQFPLLFGEETRAISNPLARCALFAAVKERDYFKDWVLVADVDGYKIEIKGEQWNQDDHDTLAQLVKMALHKPLGEDISVPVNATLAGIGKHTHKTQRQQLFRSIDRLVSTTLRITPPGLPSYHGHIVEDATTPLEQKVLPEYRRRLTYRLNKKFSKFFDDAFYTLFDQRERIKIGSSPLAKWLHFWIIGHAEQYPHKVETIRQKCGSQTKDLKAFRQKLRRALDELKEAGIVATWQIDAADLVHIQRTPSAAQLEHLTKKTAKSLKPPSARRPKE
jgi:hypothetical protein